ncbi:MAG: helix-turn-helix domain-containing protein, partial [Alphaproteobacteria bacterium]
MGRDRKNERRGDHYAAMHRSMMDTPAWRALSPVAQALYPWLRLEWHGPKANNNGRIRLSVRQAAEKMGVSINTAARAFHELQAKGFIVVTEPACLGVEGQGTSPAFELTEIQLPNSDG